MIDQGEAEKMAEAIVSRYPFVRRSIKFLWDSKKPAEYLKVGGMVIKPPYVVEKELDADGVLHVKITLPETHPAWDLIKKMVEGDTIEE